MQEVPFVVRSFLRHALTFVLTLGVCAALLLAVCAVIPQSAIQESCEEALLYFTENPGFPMVWDGHPGTRMDNYADCALLDVIYNADASRPLYSMVAAPYYRIEGNAIHLDFAAAVSEGKAPNNEYSRYWHGSQVLLRPLLTFTSIEGCRLAVFALLVMLNIVLSVLLVRRKLIRPLVIYWAGLLAVQAWVTAFTLEYVMTFLVMTGVCIGAVVLKPEYRSRLFLMSGVLTCFVDFLTAETLAFTIPALLCLMMSRERRENLSLKSLILWGVSWLAGYGLTFLVKWALVYIVLGGEALANALTSAAYRIQRDVEVVGGDVATVSSLSQLPLVLSRNLGCLLPFASNMSVGGMMAVVAGILALAAALIYLFRGEKIDGGFLLCAALLGLLPYLRFAVMSSHSADHYFFTFRAQMASVMALIASLAYTLEPSYILRGQKKRKRRRA